MSAYFGCQELAFFLGEGELGMSIKPKDYHYHFITLPN